MTAEAVVMNKAAVAMAADSAVTITGGRSGVKTYDTVNKLFELVRGTPVGVMVYASAELCGMPWETIIKAYRESRSDTSFKQLEDYAEDFRSFISGVSEILGPENDEFAVMSHAYAALLPVFEVIGELFEDCVTANGRVIKKRVQEVVRTAISFAEEEISQLPEAEWADKLPIARLKSTYGAAVGEFVDELFEKFELNQTQRRGLVNLSLESLRRSKHEPGSSGLVVAGFGSTDYFPKIVSTTISGRALGVLRASDTETKAISLFEPGHLETFAQDEMAWGFLSGINHKVRASILGHWNSWVSKSEEMAIERASEVFPEMGERDLKSIGKLVKDLTADQFKRFAEEMQQREDRLYLQPIWQSIAMLPKDELGVVAESLVNLTSLKQRMSIYDAQTVGGAIDVALISKGDGFVWLKRKHYFSPELNPTWHLTRRATVGSEVKK